MAKYTPEQRKFIRVNALGLGNGELTNLFNAHFKLDLPVEKIKRFKANNHISSGLTGRFPKGHVPANKGTNVGGWEPTQFKKGNKPANWVPIGSERMNGDGYVDIKVQDGKLQKNWRGKHILIWEQCNGPVPRGSVIIFGDGDRLNFDPDNLIMISRKQLVTMNKNRLIQNDADLTRTGIIMADIIQKMSDRKRSKSKRR